MDNQSIETFIDCFEKKTSLSCEPVYTLIRNYVSNFQDACFHKKSRVLFYTNGAPASWGCRICGKFL